MKTKNISIGICLFLLALSITFNSCKKKEVEVADDEETSASDNNLAENSLNDIESMGSQVSENSSVTTFKSQESSSQTGILTIAPCASVSGIGTQIITIDFGTLGCIGSDGRTRTGKLIYTLGSSTTAIHYRNPGFSFSISSLNYVVDGNQVNIVNKTITNTTPLTIPTTTNPGTNLTWSISADVTIIKAANAGTVSWKCNRTKELLNTNDPTCYKGQLQAIDWTHSKIKINGTSQGVNAKGENYSCVLTDLIKDFTCSPDITKPQRHPFISGTLDYTPGTRYKRHVDFGNNTCDLNATVTINGVTKAFIL